MTTGEHGPSDRLIRHKLVDRVYHWTMAVCVLVLLGTSFLPIIGLKFPWIDAHWIAGWVLTAVVAFHIVRALFWQDWRSMLVGARDLHAARRSARWALGKSEQPPDRPGRYPLLQKLYHHAIAFLILCAVVTGILMMAKIDGPFWTRNPYLLSTGTWAVIYVVHDLAAMAVLSAVIIHIYFAIRPEKLWMTRSMFLGWITRTDYQAHYDPALWQPEALDEGKRIAGAAAPER